METEAVQAIHFFPEAVKFSTAGATASVGLRYQRGSQHGMMKTCKEGFEKAPPTLHDGLQTE